MGGVLQPCRNNNVIAANPAVNLERECFLKNTDNLLIKMGGKASQFGIDEEDVESAVNYIRRNETSFNFLGIHIYAGTQCMSEEAITHNVINTLEIAANLRATYGLECQWINLGGGFGVSYYEENSMCSVFVYAYFLSAVEYGF